MEFNLDDLCDVAQFILDHSKRATIDCIKALPNGCASGEMRIDGFDTPIDLRVTLSIGDDYIQSDFEGTSGLDKKGINVPLVYTKAYSCYALKCAIAPDIPNNAASLAPFQTKAPENSILNALHPAPVALRHVIGHMIPRYNLQCAGSAFARPCACRGAQAVCVIFRSLCARTAMRPHPKVRGGPKC